MKVFNKGASCRAEIYKYLFCTTKALLLVTYTSILECRREQVSSKVQLPIQTIALTNRIKYIRDCSLSAYDNNKSGIHSNLVLKILNREP